MSLNKVNFKFGPNTDKAHLQNHVKDIEDIINIITTFMCENDKQNKLFNEQSIIDKIKEKYPQFQTICIKPEIPCSEPNKVFNDTRLKEIINQVQKDDLYRRMCKFKRQVILGNYINRVPISDVIYSGNLMPLKLTNMFGYPFWYNVVRSANLVDNNSYDIIGGGKRNAKYLNPYGLGRKVNLLNESESTKYIDFAEFEHQYEDYHKLNHINETINVKVCKIDSNNRMNCINKKINFDDVVEKDEHNVKVKGHNKELELAYKALQRLKRIHSLEHALDEIEIILTFIKYYTLPLKTIEKAEKINSNLN